MGNFLNPMLTHWAVTVTHVFLQQAVSTVCSHVKFVEIRFTIVVLRDK